MRHHCWLTMQGESSSNSSYGKSVIDRLEEISSEPQGVALGLQTSIYVFGQEVSKIKDILLLKPPSTIIWYWHGALKCALDHFFKSNIGLMFLRPHWCKPIGQSGEVFWSPWSREWDPEFQLTIKCVVPTISKYDGELVRSELTVKRVKIIGKYRIVGTTGRAIDIDQGVPLVPLTHCADYQYRGGLEL